MDVSNRLKSLSGMTKPALCKLWREVLKASPPRGVRRELMGRILTYKIQEQAFGALNAATSRRLRQLARVFEADSKAAVSNSRTIKSGTRIIRQWKGKTYQVTVGDLDYEFDGKRYASLSEIARLITGTRWSGPLFFGLRSNRVREVGK